MLNKILFFAGVTALSFSSFGQKNTEEVAKQLTNCECNEILMIAGETEKRYTGSWLENVEFDNGYVIFKKGASKHSWNVEKIITIHKEAGDIRVYLEKAK